MVGQFTTHQTHLFLDRFTRFIAFNFAFLRSIQLLQVVAIVDDAVQRGFLGGEVFATSDEVIMPLGEIANTRPFSYLLRLEEQGRR